MLKSWFILFLFRYIIQKQKDASKAHQIKLELIVKALNWLEVDMDVDEVLRSADINAYFKLPISFIFIF